MYYMLNDPETWVAASFILFVALLLYLKLPNKLTDYLDNRSARIARELDDARKLREEAEAVLAEYQRRASNAHAEAAAIITQAEVEAETYAREVRATFDEVLARHMAQAELKIRQGEQKALKEIRTQVSTLAIAGAEQVLKQKISGVMSETMITTSIDGVKKRLH